MARPGRNVHVRLTDESARRFDEIAAEFSGLPAGTVLRLMIDGQLARPLDETIAIITTQIRPGSPKKKGAPGKSGLNARNRIAGE